MSSIERYAGWTGQCCAVGLQGTETTGWSRSCNDVSARRQVETRVRIPKPVEVNLIIPRTKEMLQLGLKMFNYSFRGLFFKNIFPTVRIQKKLFCYASN